MKILPHLSIARIARTLIAAVFIFNATQTCAQTDKQSKEAISQLVNDYSKGFINKDFDITRNSIGQQLIMVNGNFSGDPVDWQAHQFLDKKDIDEWILMMFANAGPFENQLTIKNIDIRGNSALAVTREKGRNKFRSWESEEVAYMLGKVSQNWKIIGIFIKNLKNPE